MQVIDVIEPIIAQTAFEVQARYIMRCGYNTLMEVRNRGLTNGSENQLGEGVAMDLNIILFSFIARQSLKNG